MILAILIAAWLGTPFLTYALEPKPLQEPLSFIKALEILEERDLQIQSQRARVQEAEAQRLAATAEFLPTLNAQATDYQLELPNFHHAQKGLLLGSLNLFRSGADLAERRASQAAYRRERFLLSETILKSETENVALLVRYIQMAQQLRVAATLLKLNEGMAETENARYQRGLIPLQEAQKAAIERSNSLARFQDARARLEEVRAELSAQLGHSEIQDAWPWKPFLILPKAERWIKKEFNLKSTPIWQASIEAVESQDQLTRATFRDHLPALDLNVGYGYQDYLSSREPGWETSLILTIPLIDFRKLSAYRVQRQQKALAMIEQERVKRDLTSQWDEYREKTYLALKSAAEREENVRLAQSLYQDNQRRLRAGRSNLNDVVVDQNRLADAEVLAINGWAEAHLLYTRLCHTLGLRVNIKDFGCQSAN